MSVPVSSRAEIERPRSALHSGDFREGASQARGQEIPAQRRFDVPERPSDGRLASSPTTPWYSHLLGTSASTNEAWTAGRAFMVPRSRAPSLGSYPLSYVLKAPTSPLVYQASNTDLDSSTSHGSMDCPDGANRRRTLPPETFRGFGSTSQGIQFDRSYSEQSEDGAPQAPPPRRAVTSAYVLQPASSPQTPSRIRRPSYASEQPPALHAPMVGSYEESILRGRMSTTPSKPLDFTAQIGVLGMGKCKPSLRCPPHVTVPFPAVFYSYPTSGNGRSIADDSPSPYVGLIDLENSLPPADSNAGHPDSGLKREKRSSTGNTLKAPPGGSYRIPQRGQLQIIIKNPNKTAVKLFLVPYDLDGMEPGTKTFIRQRSYSAGPIIDMPLTQKTDRPQSPVADDPNKDKPTLRYLIHLNICCPSKGRFYLYSTIRVVFANRVPDGKEKLHNEIQYPEPRYSPYKPATTTTTTTTKEDRERRRRSAGPATSTTAAAAGSSTQFPHRTGPALSASQLPAIPLPMPPSTNTTTSADNDPFR